MYTAERLAVERIVRGTVRTTDGDVLGTGRTGRTRGSAKAVFYSWVLPGRLIRQINGK